MPTPPPQNQSQQKQTLHLRIHTASIQLRAIPIPSIRVYITINTVRKLLPAKLHHPLQQYQDVIALSQNRSNLINHHLIHAILHLVTLHLLLNVTDHQLLCHLILIPHNPRLYIPPTHPTNLPAYLLSLSKTKLISSMLPLSQRF